ncbi:hypothetical protein CTAYLR_008675 [Chrysophaeum taylorii]|uniref:TauD/TfdA-like domain-containing protein n=1 Tax=Chrysophaeum taylorii TaxID=2483200 RepID=A0AAD7UQ67_9STRA|nr:hypothetical protein CTAYLR_008675 [Chrysophaeum taylorii]
MRFLEARDPERPKATAQDIAAKPDQTWPLIRAVGDGDFVYVNPKNTRGVVDSKNGNHVPGGLELVREVGTLVVEHVYAHKWEPGDLVFWDNRKLLHAASPFDANEFERLLFRSEFAGEIPKVRLRCSPSTVCWGFLEQRPPVLEILSGAVVQVETVGGSPEVVPTNGTWRIPTALGEIHRTVKDRVGPHILTGPIKVQGAEPGDALKVEILETRCPSDWAWTLVPGRTGGGLAMLTGKSTGGVQLDTPRYTRLNEGWAYPSWGGELETAPFFGVLGVAPREGRVNSIPPSDAYGGNLDLKLLTSGATLYLPVQVSGALLFVGDGRARQGDGECCGTALETALDGILRLTVLKTPQITAPRAETDDLLITIACDASLDTAVALALERMLDWLAQLRPRLARLDAYCLCSVAADVRVTQFVNGDSRGAHVALPKQCLPASAS